MKSVFWWVDVWLSGFQASPQDRFLVMAAEMDTNTGSALPDLAQFWKEVPKTKVMEHRWRPHAVSTRITHDVALRFDKEKIVAVIVSRVSCRLRCHVLDSPKSILNNSFENSTITPTNEHQDLQTTVRSSWNDRLIKVNYEPQYTFIICTSFNICLRNVLSQDSNFIVPAFNDKEIICLKYRL